MKFSFSKENAGKEFVGALVRAKSWHQSTLSGQVCFIGCNVQAFTQRRGRKADQKVGNFKLKTTKFTPICDKKFRFMDFCVQWLALETIKTIILLVIGACAQYSCAGNIFESILSIYKCCAV